MLEEHETTILRTCKFKFATPALPTSTEPDLEPFCWGRLPENQQSKEYLAYMTTHLPLPQGYQWKCVGHLQQLLTPGNRVAGISLHGTSDVCAVNTTIWSSYPQSSLWAVPSIGLIVELKKPEAVNKAAEREVLGQLLGAAQNGMHTDSTRGHVALLTDLNTVWRFMWFSPQDTLCRSECSSRVAADIIRFIVHRHLNSHAPHELPPDHPLHTAVAPQIYAPATQADEDLSGFAGLSHEDHQDLQQAKALKCLLDFNPWLRSPA